MSVNQYDLECLLQQQASQFSMRVGGENESAIKIYLICDFEFAYDRSRHDGYKVAEGASAEPRIRWPFHSIAAVCWQVMRCVPFLETPLFDPPVVMSNDDHTEVEMVDAFFSALTHESAARLITWGGETRDLAVLRRMAEENGLLLPPQITDLSPLAFSRIDLCQATGVRADSVHLPEYATACAIPSKPSPSKSIGKLVERADWVKVEDQVLADVLTTTVILINHLRARSVITCDRAATFTALAETASAAVNASEFMKRSFLPWARAHKAAAGLRGTVYRATDVIIAPQLEKSPCS